MVGFSQCISFFQGTEPLEGRWKLCFCVFSGSNLSPVPFWTHSEFRVLQGRVSHHHGSPPLAKPALLSLLRTGVHSYGGREYTVRDVHLFLGLWDWGDSWNLFVPPSCMLAGEINQKRIEILSVPNGRTRARIKQALQLQHDDHNMSISSCNICQQAPHIWSLGTEFVWNSSFQLRTDWLLGTLCCARVESNHPNPIEGEHHDNPRNIDIPIIISARCPLSSTTKIEGSCIVLDEWSVKKNVKRRDRDDGFAQKRANPISSCFRSNLWTDSPQISGFKSLEWIRMSSLDRGTTTITGTLSRTKNQEPVPYEEIHSPSLDLPWRLWSDWKPSKRNGFFANKSLASFKSNGGPDSSPFEALKKDPTVGESDRCTTFKPLEKSPLPSTYACLDLCAQYIRVSKAQECSSLIMYWVSR